MTKIKPTDNGESSLIQIKQLNYLEPNGDVFTITKNYLTIENCRYVLNSCENRKIVYRKKIDDKSKAIFTELLSDKIINLDTLYQHQMTDGFCWEIMCKYPQLKKITIENQYVPQIDSLFEEINKLIRTNKHKLTKTSFFQ